MTITAPHPPRVSLADPALTSPRFSVFPAVTRLNVRVLFTQLLDVAALLSGPDHKFCGEELPAPEVGE